MKKALKLSTRELVDADDVLKNKSEWRIDYIDPEEEFHVNFVCDSKGHSGPYFRYYLSKKDYDALTPDRKQRYDIVTNLEHFAESPWHREWKERVGTFCEDEKYIYNRKTGKYKRTDSFVNSQKICVEFQHSYIDNDYVARNNFYKALGLRIIWLFDYTMHSAKEMPDGTVQIVEDNARGFLRGSREIESFEDCPVFIQVNNKKIYKVLRLERQEIGKKLESTIRWFKKTYAYTEDEFVNALRTGDRSLFSRDDLTVGKSMFELWKPEFKSAIFKNIKTGYYVKIIRSPREQINIYRNIRGYLSKDKKEFKDEDRRDINYADRPQWVLEWYK